MTAKIAHLDNPKKRRVYRSFDPGQALLATPISLREIKQLMYTPTLNVFLLQVRVRCSARKVKQNFIEINLISWSFLDVFLSRDEGKKQTFVTWIMQKY